MQLHAVAGKPLLDVTGAYTCPCGKTYHNRSGLYKHLKNYPSHKVDTGKAHECDKISCSGASCTFSCRHLDQLRKHLTEKHGLVMNQERNFFPSDESKYKVYSGLNHPKIGLISWLQLATCILDLSQVHHIS